jgi:RNA polymerase sigma-70 factor, ECF subfamily
LIPHELQADAEKSERVTLAFLMALQHLTPVQRAILLLREVLEWEASEVAEWLHLSVLAVNSALQRAQRALRQRHVGSEAQMVLPRPQLQELLDRYVTLWEQTNIPGLVALLREDAWFTMPPFPVWYQGRAAITILLQTHFFTPSLQWHLLPTHANGSPAFGLYRREAGADNYQLVGLVVLGMEGEQIGSLVVFLDVTSFTFFGLPPTSV